MTKKTKRGLRQQGKKKHCDSKPAGNCERKTKREVKAKEVNKKRDEQMEK